MCSSGIRLGAWEYARWKHVKPIKNENSSGQQEVIVAAESARLCWNSRAIYHLYDWRAFRSLYDWMEFRKLHGEEINGDSWLMRDLWEASNIKREAIRSLAKNPKQLRVSGIKHLLNKAWKVQGVRGMLKEGETRHEFKEAHGFRKFFMTRANQEMNRYNVEILMGHDIGLAGSYYKPEGLLQEYLQKAAPYLSINEVDKSTVEQTRKELEELRRAERIDPSEIARLRADQEELKKLMRTVYRLVIDKDTIAEIQMPYARRHKLESDTPRIVKEFSFMGLEPSQDATTSDEWDLGKPPALKKKMIEESLKVDEKKEEEEQRQQLP